MKINKKRLILIISVIILMLLLIGVIFLNINNNDAKENSDNTANNNSESKLEKKPKYSCKIQLEDNETATTYLLEIYEVKDGRILSATHNILIETKTEDYYNSLKSIEEYSQGKTFDDKERTITFKNNEDIDYTKTPDGGELNLKYDEYIKELKEKNYVCE